MKESIKLLKQDLKSIAKKIKNQKKVRKQSHPHFDKYEGDWRLLLLKQEFRHKHVAYCLARGRTLEQVDKGNRLDLDRVDWIIKTMQPESREKLYIIVNQNLTPSQQAVQSAHAVAEFVRKNPNTQWKNGYLVLLKDTPGYGGDIKIGVGGHCETASFVEPDLNNKVTAVAVFGIYAERAMKSKVLL